MSDLLEIISKALPLYSIVNINSRAEWEKVTGSLFFKTRLELEGLIISHKVPIKKLGWCGTCASYKEIEFTAMHSMVRPDGSIIFAFSETANCTTCMSNS